MSTELAIRPFQEQDAAAVQDLFVLVNRQLAPPGGHDAFEAYIARSLMEEMGRVAAYYRERGGAFWVGALDTVVVGMFGLERAGPNAMELRRMYVDSAARRRGIARRVLVQFKLWVCTSPKGAYFITLPIPRSRQQAYFYL